MKDYQISILNESAVTGIEEIDRQHRNLLNLCNDVNNALEKNLSSISTRSIVRELLSYSIYHFNTEELLMQEYACTEEEKAETGEHIAQHRQFARRIVSLQEKLLKREYIDQEELLVFLTGWINDHVLNTDKALARLIHKKQKQ